MAADNSHLTEMHDEQGKPSFGRQWFKRWLVFTVIVVTGHLLGAWTLDAITAGIITTGLFLLGAMAGGPRIAQYFGPQIGNVLGSISKIRLDQIRKDPREPKPTDNEADE